MSDEETNYKVVFCFDRGKSAIFEGPEEAVWRWLDNVNQRSMWEVYNEDLFSYESADDFLERLAEKYKAAEPLTKEDVRRIIDERVSEILESVAKEAENNVCGLAAYEVSDLMKPAFSAIHELLENIVKRLDPQEEG